MMVFFLLYFIFKRLIVCGAVMLTYLIAIMFGHASIIVHPSPPPPPHVVAMTSSFLLVTIRVNFLTTALH